MRLTIWDHPAAAFLLSGLDASPYRDGVEVEKVDSRGALDRLLAAETDVALIPTLDALEQHEKVDVIPAVALSTWRFPFVRIQLPSGLAEPPARLALDQSYRHESIVARIVLKEHYRMTPEFVGVGEARQDTARMTVGTTFSRDDDALALDLGQEWFELSGYPMLWGVFAVRKGEARPEIIDAVGNVVRTSESRRGLFLRSHEQTPEMHDFYENHLRVRFDDLAIAGLTEFRQFLFYYGVLEDMTELPVVFIAEQGEGEEEDEGEDGHKPML